MQPRTSPWDTAEVRAGLARWLPAQRWFAGRGRQIRQVRIASAPVVLDQPAVALLVVDVAFTGETAERYLVPAVLRAGAPAPPAPMPIADTGTGLLCDAAHDAEAMAGVLALIASGARREGVECTPFGGPATNAGPARPLGAEQSNSSVRYGDTYLLKWYRRLYPGLNPELEVHRQLRERGNRHVPALRGAVTGSLDGAPVTYAVLHEFVAAGEDGWRTAVGAGDDFTGSVPDLGAAVAAVHADLAGAFGTQSIGRAGLRELAAGMREQAARAVRVVPELAPLADELHAALGRVAGLAPTVATQRVHGDLHLGQTLRHAGGWLLLDFEGEPARPLAERRTAQPVARDLAGMLRSFEYAAQTRLRKHGPAPAAAERQAQAWVARCRHAFLSGYARTAPEPVRRQRSLLAAYELDKAVYELLYEARYRPELVPVPLGAIRRMLGAEPLALPQLGLTGRVRRSRRPGVNHTDIDQTRAVGREAGRNTEKGVQQ